MPNPFEWRYMANCACQQCGLLSETNSLCTGKHILQSLCGQFCGDARPIQQLVQHSNQQDGMAGFSAGQAESLKKKNGWHFGSEPEIRWKHLSLDTSCSVALSWYITETSQYDVTLLNAKHCSPSDHVLIKAKLQFYRKKIHLSKSKGQPHFKSLTWRALTIGQNLIVLLEAPENYQCD